MKLTPEPREQPGMPSVPDGISCWVGLDTEFLSDDRSDRAEILEPEVRRPSAFETPNARRVDAGGRADVSKAEAGSHTATPQVLSKTELRLPSSAPAAVARAFPIRHLSSVAGAAYLAVAWTPAHETSVGRLG